MTRKQKNLVFLVICFILVFFMYSQTLSGDFVFDDRYIVGNYSLFSNLNNIPQVLNMGYWTAESGLYRPTVLLSYVFNASFFGPDPYSFHLVNLILYALTGYLLYLLIRRLFIKQKLLAYLVPILFLVLPIHTEAVANIVGRAEILALFFSCLAFLEIIKKKTNIWLIALWLLLALSSKETAMAAWPIIFLISRALCHSRESGNPGINSGVLHLGRSSPAKAGTPNTKSALPVPPGSPIKLRMTGFLFKKYSISLFLPLIVYFTARALVLGPYFMATNATLVENPLKFASFFGRIGTALQVLVIYIKKTFWPFGLCSDYSYNQIPIVESFFNLKTLLGLFILLFFIITLIIFFKRKPILALGSAFFLFPFLVISNLIFPTGTIAGERLMYYPSVGLCIYLVVGLIALSRLSKIFYKISLIFFIVLVVFYGSISFVRNFDWLTEKDLFISAAKCAPNSVLSRSNMGTVYYFEGRYDQALEENISAHNIYDRYSKAINNLGLIYWKQGKHQEAKQEYFRAIKNWPTYEGVYENLILLEISQGNISQAKKWIKVISGGNKEVINIYLKKYGLK